jgi:mono/diheme cytochrome c family protein
MTSVWRFRILVFLAHLLLIAGIIWFVSSVKEPPVVNDAALELPRTQRFQDRRYLAGGKALYDQYCQACHGANGKGGVGPSLIDDEWLHGSSEDEIIRSIAYGYPTRGMAAWEPIIGKAGVEQVSAYILKLP